MLGIRENKSANVQLSNEHGFTMLEMVLGLGTMLAIAIIVPMGMRLLLGGGIYEQGLWKMEWELFCSQAKREIQVADHVSVQDGRISMMVDGKMVVYEKYANSIRRKVGNEGHEIMLQNISSLWFEEFEGGVEIFTVHLSGSRQSERVQLFIQ